GCGHFVFQAEDGIRAFHVTGVQTCALPICCPSTVPATRGACTGGTPSDRSPRCCGPRLRVRRLSPLFSEPPTGFETGLAEHTPGLGDGVWRGRVRRACLWRGAAAQS